MATTYAAYYQLATSNNSSRKPSAASTSSHTSTNSKTQKVMNFLAPRMPLHEPLTPTSATATTTTPRLEREETTYQPARIYDSVLRRPLFQKAKKGNETSVMQKRLSSSSSSASSRKSSASASVDNVYNVHLPGAEYFGIAEKK